MTESEKYSETQRQRGSMDLKFFKQVKKSGQAAEILDNVARIPKLELEVPLPNRRLKTLEERMADVSARVAEIEGVEAQIETEKKSLLEKVANYRVTGSGAAEVVIQNQKIATLMHQRNMLTRPEQWIENIGGLTYKDIFASKTDVRSLGHLVRVLKRRVESVDSLYVDLGAAAAAEKRAEEEMTDAALAAARTEAEAKEKEATAKAMAATELAQAPTAEAARKGALAGQAKRTLKLKKTAAVGAGAGGGAAGGGV